MANKKISELPYIPESQISGNTLVPLVTYYSATTGDTVHTYVSDLQDYLLSGQTITGGTYSAGTATFTNSSGGTFDVTGFTSGTNFANTDLTFTGNRTHNTNNNYLWLQTNGTTSGSSIYMDSTNWIDVGFSNSISVGNFTRWEPSIVTHYYQTIDRLNLKSTETVINETGIDVDFRVESDTNPNMLFVDASTNRVGIGKSNPTVELDISGDTTNSGLLKSTSISATTVSATTIVLSGSDITSSWTSYVPTWSSNGITQPTIGDGSITGAYKVIGKTCFYRGKLLFGTTTSGGSGAWEISLPFTAASADGVQLPVSILDQGIDWYQGLMNGSYGGFTTKSSILAPSTLSIGKSSGLDATLPFTWGNNDYFVWNGSYEIA
jgi:hypothetical protein